MEIPFTIENRDTCIMDLDESEQSKSKQNLVNCHICSRGFDKGRIKKHEDICSKQKKDRKIFDVTKQRIVGTEAEALLKSGKLKLDPPRPNEKKSVLTEKLNSTLTKAVLPPISKAKKGIDERKTTAYQVVFDSSDRPKTRKNTRFPTAVPPPINGNGRRLPTAKVHVDERYLSAERARGHWQSAALKARPGLSATLSDLVDNDDDEFLNSSHKSVRSDAFDYLFDSQNLNPHKLLQNPELQKTTLEKAHATNLKAIRKEQMETQQSACCVIS